MAKKTESTAVNDLINLVATQGPSVKDPGADLFSEPPKKNARMTATVPPLKGAGTVEPLPRTRAPAGTQQNASLNVPVRVSTVMPRANSIPPIPNDGRGRPGLPPPRSSASMPRPPIPSSAQLAPASLDVADVADVADVEVDVDDDLEADLLKTPVAHQPRAVAAPMTLTAEPVYPRAERGDHPNADMTGSAPWFDDSRAAERLAVPEPSHSMSESTAQVQRPQNSTLELLKKLALPMGIAIVLGVFVGGYIVFDGQGGKKRAQAANAASTDETAKPEDVTPSVAALGVANTAATDENEPASAEPVASAVKAEPVKAEPEPAKAEPEPAKVADPVKAEPEPVQVAEPVKAEPEPAKVAVATKASIDSSSVLGGAVESLPAAATAPKATKPVLVDVRIDSTPSGADVSLVDRGKTTFLGTTPISASLDPSRTYDVIFTYANKPPQVEHLDPKTATRLAVTLGKGATTEVAKPKAEKVVAKVEPRKPEKAKPAALPRTEKKVAKVADPFEDDTAALQRKLAEKKAAEKKATEGAPKAEAAVAKPAGDGTLMISSKPPCEIFIDGKSTGLMTPQRAIPLSAGKHKVTLVSPDKTIKKTIAVEISADKATKVIQDLLK